VKPESLAAPQRLAEQFIREKNLLRGNRMPITRDVYLTGLKVSEILNVLETNIKKMVGRAGFEPATN
jgi:hypothetical protein